MHGHREALARSRHRRGGDGGTTVVDRVGQRRDVVTDQRAGIRAQPVGRQACFEVAGARDHAERGIDDEQQPVRLDRAGNVDRFAIAIGDVERRLGRGAGHIPVRP